ncbi:MAG TPA: hypothetical protein VME92_18495 [Acetobacteraceae bacterium]|nr:hypothetical protein [Acetobacteraceae bacterium]
MPARARLARPPSGRPGLCRRAARGAALALALLGATPVVSHARGAHAAPAPAQPSESWEATQSDLCTHAIAAAEHRQHTPPGLLLTMGKVESGRPIPPHGKLGPWPWTIDADGQGLFFDSKAAAVAWAEGAAARGVRLMDVGCMQVNLQMHPNAFASLDQAFDPQANAAYAARFLRDLRSGPAGGNWYLAIGYYHSQTPALAAMYRESVAAVGAGLPPPSFGIAPLYMRALARGRVLLSLRGGGVTLLNLARQPTRWPHHHPSACRIAEVLGPYLRSPPKGCGAHHLHS